MYTCSTVVHSYSARDATFLTFTAELYIVQLIQSVGSGLVQTIILVVAQIVVPRAELSQSTALELLFIYMGNALGSTAAGAIYTNSFKE